ncbi:MAG: methionine adenosyltransferase [bacterium]
MIDTHGKTKEEVVKEAMTAINSRKEKVEYYSKKGIRTAECVSPGHPDKVCDQISDGLLDEYLRQDPESRVAIETMGGHGHIYITGEVTSCAKVDVKNIVQNIYSEIGYSDELEIHINIVHQSPEIAQGVDTGGAGDQGIMVGYACDENEEMIPQELYLARQLMKNLPKGFGPDAKSQVTLGENGKVDTVVISAQHLEGADFTPLRILAETLEPKHIHINPTGEFVVGGFTADTGLTGRKLAVDNYGPQIPIGGGCFSGKDATKVDRSAAYMARRIAVDYLRKENAHEVLVKLAYSIGVAEPVMAIAIIDNRTEVNLLGSNEYDLTPRGIISFLKLKKPMYLETAKHGHFGSSCVWDK